MPQIFTLNVSDMGKLQRLWDQFQRGLMTPEEYAGEVALVVSLARADFDATQQLMPDTRPRCESVSEFGQRCTMHTLHMESDGDPNGGIYHVSDTGDIWE